MPYMETRKNFNRRRYDELHMCAGVADVIEVVVSHMAALSSYFLSKSRAAVFLPLTAVAYETTDGSYYVTQR